MKNLIFRRTIMYNVAEQEIVTVAWREISDTKIAYPLLRSKKKLDI